MIHAAYSQRFLPEAVLAGPVGIITDSLTLLHESELQI